MVNMLSLRCLTAFLLSVVACSVCGQTPSEDGALHLQTGTQMVRFDVGVTERQDLPVQNLKATDFRVLDNGREQPASYFAPMGAFDKPVALVLVVGVYPEARDAVLAFRNQAEPVLRRLQRDDEVAIFTFGQKEGQVLAFSSKAREVTGALDAILSGPELAAASTASANAQALEASLDRSLRLAAHYAASRPMARKEIITVAWSDVAETGHALEDTKEDTSLFLLREGVVANCLGSPRRSGGGGWFSRLMQAGHRPRSALEYYATQTGGVCLSDMPEGAFGSGLSKLLLSMWAQYGLGWKPPENDGRFHNVTVELRGGRQARLRVKRGYFAPPSPRLAAR